MDVRDDAFREARRDRLHGGAQHGIPVRQVAGAMRRKVPAHNLGRGCRNSRRALELIEATAVRGVWDAPMKMFLGSVCAAAVVAGAVAATAQTGVASSRQPVQAESGVNRVSKADRLPSRNTIVVKTISITAATDHEQAMASQHLDGCEFVVSPLADLAASRRLRHCAS